ncbi:MAG: type III polyketide synthase [Tuberibacillus sp.]
MSQVLSIGTWNPPHVMGQMETMQFARDWFQNEFENIDRLLKVFQNGQIEERYFSAPINWFKQAHSFEEKNNLYRKVAVESGISVIQKCINNKLYLNANVRPEEINAIFLISSTGISTPSIDASIMNRLPFSPHTKRIPIWGLGCAGGTAGLARADEYCRANPGHSALVLSIELCSLTFQHGDMSKSNLVGTSLFADGAACVLVCGDESPLLKRSSRNVTPKVIGSESALMPQSEDVMGWDIRNDGLFVVFAKSIPVIVSTWFKPVFERFIEKFHISMSDINYFIVHPGGKKVLDAYAEALNINRKRLEASADILRKYGNMSSPTVLFVLDQILQRENRSGEKGIAVSLGPGFSAELLLLEWSAGA